MEFFCYHRDRPGSMTQREELLEEHWSYMDLFQAGMIARRPTLTDDGCGAIRRRGAGRTGPCCPTTALPG